VTSAAVTAGSRPTVPSRTPKRIATIGLVVVVAWALLSIDVRVERLVDLPAELLGIARRMFFPPDWSYVGRALDGMITSLQIAWIGTLIGALFSLPLGFLGAKNVTSGLVANIVRQVLNAIRAVPELVLAVVIFIPIAGLGPVAGALAIGIHSIGTLGKLTAEVVEGIDSGPVEAARAAGADSLQVQRWGVLPQVLPDIIAFWLYRFEINIRASAVLGVLGAGGVGEILNNTLNFRRYELAGMTILVIIVVTIAVDLLSGWVRRRIIQGAPGAASEVREEPDRLAAAV
jgi:phosphonate transport system permease protein